jgi:hypothetical protein
MLYPLLQPKDQAQDPKSNREKTVSKKKKASKTAGTPSGKQSKKNFPKMIVDEAHVIE